jgi:hypothetical protein
VVVPALKVMEPPILWIALMVVVLFDRRVALWSGESRDARDGGCRFRARRHVAAIVG